MIFLLCNCYVDFDTDPRVNNYIRVHNIYFVVQLVHSCINSLCFINCVFCAFRQLRHSMEVTMRICPDVNLLRVQGATRHLVSNVIISERFSVLHSRNGEVIVHARNENIEFSGV